MSLCLVFDCWVTSLSQKAVLADKLLLFPTNYSLHSAHWGIVSNSQGEKRVEEEGNVVTWRSWSRIGHWHIIIISNKNNVGSQVVSAAVCAAIQYGLQNVCCSISHANQSRLSSLSWPRGKEHQKQHPETKNQLVWFSSRAAFAHWWEWLLLLLVLEVLCGVRRECFGEWEVDY